jgi:hypothetical protein
LRGGGWSKLNHGGWTSSATSDMFVESRERETSSVRSGIFLHRADFDLAFDCLSRSLPHVDPGILLSDCKPSLTTRS